MKIRAILLDFDGIIVESERQNGQLLRAFLRDRFGVEISDEDERRVNGFAWPDTFGALIARHRIPTTFAAAWQPFLEAKLAFLDRHPPRVATGLAELLALPVLRAVVSGSEREEILAMAARTRLPPGTLNLLIANGDVTRPKPDPEGYLQACRRLGVRAREALVFEDSRPGIAAARSAGASVAFVRELATEDNARLADRAFGTLADAVPWVRERLVP